MTICHYLFLDLKIHAIFLNTLLRNKVNDSRFQVADVGSTYDRVALIRQLVKREPSWKFCISGREQLRDKMKRPMVCLPETVFLDALQ